MRRARELVGGLFLIAAVVALLPAGCGPEKQLPGVDDVTRPTSAAPEPPAPTADAEARKLVDKCIAAATDGHPERLQKAKVSRMSVKGTVVATGDVRVLSTRLLQGVWPDRVFFSWDLQTDPPQKMSFAYLGPAVWMRRGDEPLPVINPAAKRQVFAEDAAGQFWMLTLLPLVEPSTSVYDVKPVTLDGREYDTVKAKLADYPVVYSLWFERKTSRLMAVTYTHVEDVQPVRKAVELDQYQAVGGISLPTKILYKQNDRPLQWWTEVKWEFPEKLNDSIFIEPKAPTPPPK